MTMAVRRELGWRAMASLAIVACLSALLLYEGLVVTRIDLILIGGVLLVLTALALAWKPHAALLQEDAA